MGTTWNLKSIHATAEFHTLIQQHLDQRESVLSHWQKNSAITRFNDSRSTDWQDVPSELAHAVELARRISSQTDGALDITLVPVIDLWGFGATGAVFAPPTEAALQEARSHTGWPHLQSRAEPPALKKDISELKINVASVAEGLIMDELISLLRNRGLTDFLLEVGGEVAAIGHAPDKQPWRVGIQTPRAAPGDITQSLPLTDQCAATSGDYRQHFEKDGTTYSHLIDPRTGRPIQHPLSAVSVIHPSCALADGYATALMILGPEAGRKTAEKLGLRVIWIEGD